MSNTIDDRMTSHLADAAVHSGRGGQLRAHRYQRTLRAHGLTGSMGGVLRARDDAAMERFLPAAQERLHRRTRATRDGLR